MRMTLPLYRRDRGYTRGDNSGGTVKRVGRPKCDCSGWQEALLHVTHCTGFGCSGKVEKEMSRTLSVKVFLNRPVVPTMMLTQYRRFRIHN